MELVASTDNMDDETFAKHMMFRHGESLGGLNDLDFTNRPHIAQMYRAFHKKLHQWRVDLEHEHDVYRPEERNGPGSSTPRSGR